MSNTVPTFAGLGLIAPLIDAVSREGYERPTPIQCQAIPHVLAGRDLLGLAQTGTGKTAAFALPMLQRLHADANPARGRRPIRALVLTPTRELAAQIGESFATYGQNLGHRHAVIFGGVGHQPQRQALAAGVDILVATPGRLLDLCGEGIVDLSRLSIFVLDEADRMLDMGFIHDVRRVITLLPKRRQTLFFSATMPSDAQRLADQLLTDPAHVAVHPVSSTVDRIEQSVYFCEKADKRALLEDLLYDAPEIRRCLVFTRTKHGANRVAEHLTKTGMHALAIHGNKSQGARERAMLQFRTGEIRILVATDIAARGIDIDDITHVVQFDLPEVPETYVHRIGRTARAGADGIALALCEPEDVGLLRDIEKLIRKEVPVAEGQDIPRWAQRGAPIPPRPPNGQRGRGFRNDRRPDRPFERDPRRDQRPASSGSRGPAPTLASGSRSPAPTLAGGVPGGGPPAPSQRRRRRRRRDVRGPAQPA